MNGSPEKGGGDSPKRKVRRWVDPLQPVDLPFFVHDPPYTCEYYGVNFEDVHFVQTEEDDISSDEDEEDADADGGAADGGAAKKKKKAGGKA